MRETDKYYLFWKHQFGQWTIRNMSDPNGIIYNCCEQYMMYKKAQLFSDNKMALKILKEENPASQQKMGREVKGFIPEKWDKHKIGIVWYGNYLKFTQHEDLRIRLLKTESKIIAEASPYDLVWGIGLRAMDDYALNEDNWIGQNLLGKTLMSVRESLKLIN